MIKLSLKERLSWCGLFSFKSLILSVKRGIKEDFAGVKNFLFH